MQLRRFLFSGDGWPYLLVPFIPIAIALDLAHAGAALVFSSSALGVIPTAALMGKATEELASRSGPGIGGLLNVTFGNAPELIIALFALHEGLQEVVKASLVGSILGNILLVMGAAMLVGGWKRERQSFDRTAASVQALMLLLAAAALAMPAIFQLVSGGGLPKPEARVRQLQRRHRAPVGRGRGRAAADLHRRAVLLAQDPPRPLQPRALRRGRGGRAVDGAQGRDHARRSPASRSA